MPYTRQAWSTPESDLEAAEFCALCLIDANPSGEAKVKSKCKLPIRKTPGGPINVNALVAAYAALRGGRGGVKGVSPEARKKAARMLRRHYRGAGMDVPPALDRMAG